MAGFHKRRTIKVDAGLRLRVVGAEWGANNTDLLNSRETDIRLTAVTQTESLGFRVLGWPVIMDKR